MRPAASRRPWPPERRDAGVPASKLRCDEGLGGETQQGICYLRIYVQRRVQPVQSREASALASALPRRAASRAAVVTAFRRAAAILESTSEEVSTVDCRAYTVSALASALEACSPEASAAAPRRALATLVSTSSGVILAAMSRECWSTTLLRP